MFYTCLPGGLPVVLFPQWYDWNALLVAFNLLPGKSHGQRSLVGYDPGLANSWTRLSDWAHTCSKSRLRSFPWHFFTIGAELMAESWFCRCMLSRSVLSDCDLLECSPPGSSIYGIFQARILECRLFTEPITNCCLKGIVLVLILVPAAVGLWGIFCLFIWMVYVCMWLCVCIQKDKAT